jgi:hypothetical protein
VELKREELNGLHSLEIYQCPIEVLAALARAAAVDVTVENIRPIREWNKWFESKQSLFPDAPSGRRLLRNATFDAALKNEEFLALMPYWDRMGVYALFTERSPIAFQASSLEPPARYKALANFGFVLEFALGDGSGSEWSGIVSPRSELIDLAERLANG